MAPVIAAALAEAVRTMGSTRTVDETLTALAEATRNSLPGFDQVGVSTIDRHGVIETRAATGQLVLDLDKLQYELGEGPCLDGMRSGPIVQAPDIRHDQRWPR